MRIYFIIFRKKNGKVYCLAESHRQRQKPGIGYAWVRAENGLGAACLFESHARAQSIARNHIRPGEDMPDIIAVREEERFVITAEDNAEVYWLERTMRGDGVRYAWRSSPAAESKAYHFITRAAAEQVAAQARRVRGGTPTVSKVIIRVPVERTY